MINLGYVALGLVPPCMLNWKLPVTPVPEAALQTLTKPVGAVTAWAACATITPVTSAAQAINTFTLRLQRHLSQRLSRLTAANSFGAFGALAGRRGAGGNNT